MAGRAMEALFSLPNVKYTWSSDKYTRDAHDNLVPIPRPEGPVGPRGPTCLHGPNGFGQDPNKYTVLESPWSMNILCIHITVTADKDNATSDALKSLLGNLQGNITSPMLVCTPAPRTTSVCIPNPKYTQDELAAFKAKDALVKNKVDALYRELETLGMPFPYDIDYPTVTPHDVTLRQEVKTYEGTSFDLVCGDKTSELRKMLRDVDKLFNILPSRERVIYA